MSQAPDEVAATYTAVLRRQLDLMDPPRHAVLRQVFAAAFGAERLSHSQSFAVRWLAGRLSNLPHRFDFIAEVARPLPLAVVLDFLGLPTDSQPGISGAVAQFVDGLRDPVGSHAATTAALQSLRGQLAGVLSRTDLAEASFVHRVRIAIAQDIEFEEIVAATVLMIAAGHDTTTHLIGNGAWLLLTHPAERALIASDSTHGWHKAIDEILRFETPVQNVRRIATETLDVGGQRIEAGRQLVLAIGAANRDPAAFSDPDRFDVRRSPNRHLAFGFGAHFCLGAQLARLQARTALEALFSRPLLRATTLAPDWMASSAYRGLNRLVVEC